jgi:AcrR family transcriptional regulator
MARSRSLDAHNRVLEATLDLFVERGIEATSMDTIAAASGVSKATIYKHWKGKEPLLMELLLLVSGAATEVDEQDADDLYLDLARVLTDRPRHDRPEDKNRLMPQMIAYSATHVEFGKAWRSRVMEVPKRRLKRILEQAMQDGRIEKTLDLNICYALLIGPLMFLHIFGSEVEHVTLGNAAAKTFCRAYELKSGGQR